jgi:hypothetical protein
MIGLMDLDLRGLSCGSDGSRIRAQAEIEVVTVVCPQGVVMGAPA